MAILRAAVKRPSVLVPLIAVAVLHPAAHLNGQRASDALATNGLRYRSLNFSRGGRATAVTGVPSLQTALGNTFTVAAARVLLRLDRRRRLEDR